MIRDYRTVREVASRISDAARATMDAYREERFTDEPHITDRLMGAIEAQVDGLTVSVADAASFDDAVVSTPEPELIERSSPGLETPPTRRARLVWRAMTLRAGSGSAAHEKQFGADVLGVLTINTSDYNGAKGFLAQAKRAEPGVPFPKLEWDRLVAQCETMLQTTPDSFVLVYSKRRGVRFLSAQAVRSFAGRDLFHLYDISVRGFFERHIESFIGDARLNRPHIDILKQLRVADADPPSAHVLHLMATETE